MKKSRVKQNYVKDSSDFTSESEAEVMVVPTTSPSIQDSPIATTAPAAPTQAAVMETPPNNQTENAVP